MEHLSQEKLDALKEIAYRVRDISTRIICVGRWGHIGGSYSLAEILAVLYDGFANINADCPQSVDRDYVVLSKAHCSPALYAVLANKGFITMEQALGYCKIDGLDGHSDQLNTPGVEVTGGSLGIGLSYSVGIAKALKMQERFSQRVYCIVGDGELSEGEMWEGIMSASQFKLDNLIVIVDYNKVMAKGFIYDEMCQEPMNDRFRAFGWEVIETDGHDMDEIYHSLYRAKYICVTGKPICVIAHTVKGRGVQQCEFNYQWHTHAPAVAKANEFLKEIAAGSGKEYIPITEPLRPIYSLQDVVMGGNEYDI